MKYSLELWAELNTNIRAVQWCEKPRTSLPFVYSISVIRKSWHTVHRVLQNYAKHFPSISKREIVPQFLHHLLLLLLPRAIAWIWNTTVSFSLPFIARARHQRIPFEQHSVPFTTRSVRWCIPNLDCLCLPFVMYRCGEECILFTKKRRTRKNRCR